MNDKYLNDRKKFDESIKAQKESGKIRSPKSTSGFHFNPAYSQADIDQLNLADDIGWPGQYPYTRGVQASMYRGRLWTMRMFAGLGSAEETNERFHYLVDQGQTGLSTAFDMPTLMGYDTGDPKALGECGTCGVAIDTLTAQQSDYLNSWQHGT